MIKQPLTSNQKLLAKKNAGYAAAELVQNEMVIGLGTGSTATCFIEALSKRCQQGLKVKAVATSEKSMKLAQKCGIELLDASAVTWLDLTVDGADEIDDHKNMVKGGGGALLREKILATSSHEMIVIIDESKQVAKLGNFPLPVEISAFAYSTTLSKLKAKGYLATLRLDSLKNLYVTDNHNLIVDIDYSCPILDPEMENNRLKSISGVLETGLFINVAGRVVIGHSDGKVTINP